MDQKTDKDTLQKFLNRISNDHASIQAAIAKYQQDITEAKQKIIETERNLEKYIGAYNYTSSLREALQKEFEEIEKQQT
jgi:septal ring factor EnvC (AmiA/AmiB activator)